MKIGSKRKREEESVGASASNKKRKIADLAPKENGSSRDEIFSVLSQFFGSPAKNSFLQEIIDFIACGDCEQQNVTTFLESCSKCCEFYCPRHQEWYN